MIYCSLFNYFASRFTEKLTAGSTNVDNKKLATNLFLEVNFNFYFKS